MSDENTQTLRVGAAEAVVTPPVGLRLLGPMDRSTGVNDDLYARSVVVSDGESTVALVFVDLIGFDLPFSDRMKAEIAKRTGISTVLINCTHTHSAPFTIPWSAEGRAEYERESGAWQEQLVSSVAEVVSRAKNGLRESTVKAGRARAQVGMNRRKPTENGIEMLPNPEGPVVPWVDVLCFEACEGDQKVVVISHAAHPVIIHGASRLMSADYPGFAVEEVRRQVGGGSVMAAFAQGSCGNINGEPLRGGIDSARQAGVELAAAVMEALAEAERVNRPRIRTISHSITLPLQELPTRKECDQLLRGQQYLLKTTPDDYAQQWYARNNVLCARQLCAIVEKGEQPEGIHFEINGLALGNDFCLITMTDEVFCDYQLWASENSPFKHTMVWGYTNGCEMYIPTDSALALGGIEAASCPTPGYTSGLYYHNRLTLRTGVEGLVKGGLGNVLTRLCQAP